MRRVLGSPRRRGRVSSALVAAVCLVPMMAQGQGALDGTYRGGSSAYEVTLSIAGGQGTASIATSGCLGELSGEVAAQSADQWTLTGTEYGTTCTLTMTRSGADSFAIQQGPGCTFFHGAACSFETDVQKVK